MICSLLTRNIESQAVFIYDHYLSELPSIVARAFDDLKNSIQLLGRFLWNKMAEWKGVAAPNPIEIPQNGPEELILLINRLNHWQATGKQSELRHDACLQILKCREQIIQGQTNSLDLSNHSLKDLPPIFNLSPFEQLSHLHLSGNRLTSLPACIQSLASLNILDLSCNRLKALPNISVLTELTELNVHYNYLKSLPEDISSLQKLTRLDASYNLLDNLPEAICYLPDLTTLNLSHNRVRRLSDELGFLDNLTDLHLNDNRLNELPNTLKNLKKLTSLTIQSNPFPATPQIVTDLPVTCTVALNGQPPRKQRYWPFTSQLPPSPEPGPAIRYLPSEEAEGESSYHTLDAQISELFSIANQRQKPLLHLNSAGQKQKKSLRDWLNRLPAVLLENSNQKKQLANRIVSYLKYAEGNLRFQEFFFGYLDEATTQCDDRAAFPILKIGIGYQLACLDKKNIDQLAQFLIKTVWTMDLLEQCAQKKCKADPSADPIEVYLAYPIQLKDRLDLEIPLESMKYFASSHVTPQDLTSANNFVISQRRDVEAQHLFLKDQETWLGALRIAYPEEYKQMELDNEKDHELYPLDLDSEPEIEKNAQIQTKQRDLRLIALSKRAFSEKDIRIS